MDMEDRCRPIDTLQEAYSYLLRGPPSWASSTKPICKRTSIIKNKDLYCNGSICHYPGQHLMPPTRYKYGELPKTLLCHDMKNGYLDDSPIDGTINFDAYTFYHWASIDIFVYFSHHFITIPPLGWINAAHIHGVQILGTVITEWEQGLAICNEFLRDDDEINKFAHCLTAIAKTLKLDGWLLNIENKLEKPDMMVKFVNELTSKMHREIPNSVVLWYDSVTIKGSLTWQNGLTEKNKDFFDVCDGIFTNYTWDTLHLEESLNLAGSRKNDVYVGVDVWGRNFWGGGCFNTVEAVKEIHKYGLSMAIFAPAWTHEAIKYPQVSQQQLNTIELNNEESCANKTRDYIKELKENRGLFYISSATYYAKCSLKEHFHLRENAFWNTIWEYLNTRGPINLPFKTSFCLGCGKKKRANGDITDPNLWFNVCDQQHQISVPFCSNEFYLEEEVIPPNISAPTPSTETIEPAVLDKEVKNELEVQNADGSNGEKSEVRVKKAIRPKIKKPMNKVFQIHKDFTKSTCLSIYTDDSFNGGSCIKLSPTDTNNVMRLFITEFLCDHNFIIYYASKVLPETSDQDVVLYLTMKNNRTNDVFGVILKGETDISLTGWPCTKNLKIQPINQEAEFKTIQKNILENYSKFYMPTENNNNWNVRYYCLEYPNTTILEVNSKLTKNTGSILLGGFGVISDVGSY